MSYRDSVGVVSLRGEVDIVQAHDLRERLVTAIRNEDLGLVVDLTDATYIDSVGVSLLFELAERLAERQLRLAVVVPEGGLVTRVLRIVNLKSVAEVHATVNDAVAAIQRRLRRRRRAGEHDAHHREQPPDGDVVPWSGARFIAMLNTSGGSAPAGRVHRLRLHVDAPAPRSA